MASTLATEIATLCATKPSTTGAPIGSGDWVLQVERLVGNSTGGAWDLDTWSPDGAPDVAAEWASLGWQSVNDYLRGMEWNRGAEQPNGVPHVGEINLTLSNDAARNMDPVINYATTRPGTIMRAGITSATDSRNSGWVPLWTGIVESWTVVNVAPTAAGTVADAFAQVRLNESLTSMARITKNTLASPVGSGDHLPGRVDRLLEAADWQFGLIELYGTVGASTIVLQATDMSQNRLSELYIAADSVGNIVTSDATGAALVTDRSRTRQTRLYQFSPYGALAAIVLTGDDSTSGTVWHVNYDADSVQLANDPEGVVNDHRYTRVGGTQQLVEHDVSIGTFGRSTSERNDLICTTDGNAYQLAHNDNDRQAVTALRLDSITVTATNRPQALLAMAAIDWGDSVWLYPPRSPTSTVNGFAAVRNLYHQVTPLKGSVMWTTTLSADFYQINNLPGAILTPAP